MAIGWLTSSTNSSNASLPSPDTVCPWLSVTVACNWTRLTSARMVVCGSAGAIVHPPSSPHNESAAIPTGRIAVGRISVGRRKVPRSERSAQRRHTGRARDLYLDAMVLAVVLRLSRSITQHVLVAEGSPDFRRHVGELIEVADFK